MNCRSYLSIQLIRFLNPLSWSYDIVSLLYILVEFSKLGYQCNYIFCDPGKSNNNVERSTEMTRSEHANGGDRGLQMVTEEYKLPLVWIDLEMTGMHSLHQ